MTEIASAFVGIEPQLSSRFGRQAEQAAQRSGQLFGDRFARQAEAGSEDVLGSRFRSRASRDAAAAGDDSGRRFGRGFGRRAKAEGRSVGLTFGKAVGAIAAVGLATQVGGFFRTGATDAAAYRKAMARVQAIIKATGGVANVTSADIERLAGSLEAQTGVDDEVIAGSAAMLLTFKNVRNEAGKGADVFNRAMAAALDVSAAGFGSVDSAAKGLGKALNDPIKGTAALSKQGITFSEAQKKQIKSLVASGRTLEAQKLILNEVESQVKGTAAAGLTGAERFGIGWDNLRQNLADKFIPVVDRIVGTIADKVLPKVAQFVDAVPAMITKITSVVKPVIASLSPVVDFLKKNPAVVKAFAITLGILAAAIGVVTLATAAFSFALQSTGIPLIVIGIAALVAGLVLAYQRSSSFRAIVQQLGAGLKAFAIYVQTVVLPRVLELATTVAAKLQPVLAALAQFWQSSVVPALAKVIAKFREWWPTIQQVAEVVGRMIARLVVFYATIYGKVVPVVLRFAGFLLRNLVPAVLGAVQALARIIGFVARFVVGIGRAVAAVARFYAAVATKIGQAVGIVAGLPSRVLSALGDTGRFLYDSGRKLIGGLIDGIKDKARDIKDAVGGVAEKVASFFPRSPVKKGPLRSFNGGRAGIKLMQMLTSGLKGGGEGVLKVVESITKRLSQLVKAKQLTKVAAGRFNTILNPVRRQAEKLQGVVAARNDMASQIAGNLRGEFNLSELTATNQFGISQGAGAAAAAAKGLVSRMKAFAGKLTALLKAGLPGALVGEIAGYGSVEGTRVADVLLSGSKRDIASIRGAYSSFNKYANAAGLAAANGVYGTSIARESKALREAVAEALRDTRVAVQVGIDKPTRVRIYQDGKNASDKRR